MRASRYSRMAMIARNPAVIPQLKMGGPSECALELSGLFGIATGAEFAPMDGGEIGGVIFT